MSKTSNVLWGMVIYLNKYSLTLAEIGGSLRQLTKRNAPFIWGPEYTETIEAINKEITSAPIFKC